MHVLVDLSEGRREPRSARLDRLLDDVRHRLQLLVGRRRLRIHGALAHDEGADRSVPDLRRKIHD